MLCNLWPPPDDAYTGGLSVLEDAFFAPVPLATDGGVADGRFGVYPLQARMLLPD